MRNGELLPISGAFAAASAVCLVGTIALGLALGGQGPAPINFGDVSVLNAVRANRYASLLSTVALIAPTLSLGAGLGWRDLAPKRRALASVGVLLWYIGMIFVIGQDALELAAVHEFPKLLAEEADRASTLLMGAMVSSTIEVFTLLGDLVSFGGLLLLGVALTAEQGSTRIFGAVAIVSAVLTYGGLLLPALLPMRLLGFVTFAIWLVWTAFEMLRRPRNAAQMAEGNSSFARGA